MEFDSDLLISRTVSPTSERAPESVASYRLISKKKASSKWDQTGNKRITNR